MKIRIKLDIFSFLKGYRNDSQNSDMFDTETPYSKSQKAQLIKA